MEVKQQIKTMCDRLANYHWSPKHPSEYVIKSPDGQTRGIGIIAQNNYGAFNLAWAAVEGKCKTMEEHVEIITKFSGYQAVTTLTLNDVPISDWLCFLRPNAFHLLVDASKGLPANAKQELLRLATKAINMEETSQ